MSAESVDNRTIMTSILSNRALPLNYCYQSDWWAPRHHLKDCGKVLSSVKPN